MFGKCIFCVTALLFSEVSLQCIESTKPLIRIFSLAQGKSNQAVHQFAHLPNYRSTNPTRIYTQGMRLANQCAFTKTPIIRQQRQNQATVPPQRRWRRLAFQPLQFIAYYISLVFLPYAKRTESYKSRFYPTPLFLAPEINTMI